MSFLKQLQQQTKNKVSLELFNKPSSEYSDTVLIVSKRNGEISKKTYPLTKDGIERTYKYYNVDDLKKEITKYR